MYMLFCFYSYYPGGGMNDLVGLFMTKEECFAAAKCTSFDQYQICVGSDIICSGYVNQLD